MKLKRSNYFIPFRKDTNITGAAAKMIKGGFIQQNSSGIYTWLPLGLRMLEKFCAIIDQEHQKVNALKLLMPMVQEAQLWKDSGRFDGYGSEILKMQDRNEHGFLFGPSAEELVTSIVKKWPLNKDSLPMIVYNIQWKFRDEIRPRFGVVRSREFLMKDAYSFHKTKECLMNTYEKMFQVYANIFHAIGLNICTFSSDPGLMGGFLSHEFLINSESGETLIQYDKWPAQPMQFAERDNAVEATAGDEKFAEIGHIYALGEHYTKTFNLLNVETNEPIFMGCYGIGVSRVIGLMFEQSNLGVLAPFEKNLITLHQEPECLNVAQKIFDSCDEIIWDNLETSAGVKFAEADLIGAPLQIHIGRNEIKENKITIKENGEKQTISLEHFFNQYIKK